MPIPSNASHSHHHHNPWEVYVRHIHTPYIYICLFRLYVWIEVMWWVCTCTVGMYVCTRDVWVLKRHSVRSYICLFKFLFAPFPIAMKQNDWFWRSWLAELDPRPWALTGPWPIKDIFWCLMVGSFRGDWFAGQGEREILWALNLVAQGPDSRPWRHAVLVHGLWCMRQVRDGECRDFRANHDKHPSVGMVSFLSRNAWAIIMQYW